MHLQSFLSVSATNSSRIPAIFEADVRDPPLSRASFCPHVQTIRLTNLRYFLSQLYDAFFDGILHLDRLAEHNAPESI